jgi:hypothetical protein
MVNLVAVGAQQYQSRIGHWQPSGRPLPFRFRPIRQIVPKVMNLGVLAGATDQTQVMKSLPNPGGGCPPFWAPQKLGVQSSALGMLLRQAPSHFFQCEH